MDPGVHGVRETLSHARHKAIRTGMPVSVKVPLIPANRVAGPFTPPIGVKGPITPMGTSPERGLT